MPKSCSKRMTNQGSSLMINILVLGKSFAKSVDYFVFICTGNFFV